VFVIASATQEVLLFQNAKTGEAIVGVDNEIEQWSWVAAIVRVPEDLNNEVTGGWKVFEVRSTLFYRPSFYLLRYLF
jgi:import inner membrane translocase subunit TIM44